MTTAEFSGLLVRWDMFRSTLLSFIEKYDVIICPVCATPAWPHSAIITEEQFFAGSYSIAYSLMGWPGVSVRGGTSPEGLPIGVQVVARPWREDVALAVAQHLETVSGGCQRPNILKKLINAGFALVLVIDTPFTSSPINVPFVALVFVIGMISFILLAFFVRDSATGQLSATLGTTRS